MVERLKAGEEKYKARERVGNTYGTERVIADADAPIRRLRKGVTFLVADFRFDTVLVRYGIAKA